MPRTPRSRKRVASHRRRTLNISEERQVVLHVSLDFIRPTVWRRIRVPEAYTFHQLHRVLQLVFSWLDYHLYLFQVGDRHFKHELFEDLEGDLATDVTLRDVPLKAGQRFAYTYDFGDDWRHTIKVESFLPMPGEYEFDWTPRLLDGARAGPPEDIGGPPAYAMILEALAGPSHPEAANLVGALPGGFDPERFDVEAVDRVLALVSAWGAI